MFAECDKQYPSRSGQTSLAAAVTIITKPVTKNNFRPSKVHTTASESECGFFNIFADAASYHSLPLALWQPETEVAVSFFLLSSSPFGFSIPLDPDWVAWRVASLALCAQDSPPPSCFLWRCHMHSRGYEKGRKGFCVGFQLSMIEIPVLSQPGAKYPGNLM